MNNIMKKSVARKPSRKNNSWTKALIIILIIILIGLVAYKIFSSPIKFSPIVCTDTDGGQNIWIKGTTTGIRQAKLQTVTDSCFNSTRVYENYCVYDRIATNGTDCPAGYNCKDGACITNCIDTDDGYNIYVRGTVINFPIVMSDVCSTDYRSVVENDCVNGHWHASLAACPSYYCEDGACFVAGT